MKNHYYGGDYTFGCTTYVGGSCRTYATTRNGSIVEGAVASFLSHVTEPSNLPHDNVSYPGSYVADVITNCRLVNPYLAQFCGADYMAYCLQDSLLGQTYFTTRNSTGTTVYSNPSTKPRVGVRLQSTNYGCGIFFASKARGSVGSISLLDEVYYDAALSRSLRGVFSLDGA